MTKTTDNTEQTALEKTREKELTKKQKKLQTLSDLLNSKESQSKMAKAAPKYLDTEALTRVAISAVQKNEKLMQCTAGSILQACMDCAAYGLVPNSMTNEAHLVPFKDTCVLIVGYKGLIKLATNTGLVTMVKVRKVFKNDYFKYQLGLNDILEHRPALSDPGDFIGCYAIVVFTDGKQDFRYVSKEEGLDHGRRFSKNFSSKNSTWKVDEEAMICKTSVRFVLKYVPSSTVNIKQSEMLAHAIAKDEMMETGIIDIDKVEPLKEEVATPQKLKKEEEKKEDRVDPVTGEVMPDSLFDNQETGPQD